MPLHSNDILFQLILTAPLSEHRLGQQVNSLESRIQQLPKEIQQEILQEVNICVSKREQQAWEKEEAGKTETDTNS